MSQLSCSSAVHPSEAQLQSRSRSGTQAGSSARAAASLAAQKRAAGEGGSAAAVEVPTCSICLDDFSEGSRVSLTTQFNAIPLLVGFVSRHGGNVGWSCHHA